MFRSPQSDQPARSNSQRNRWPQGLLLVTVIGGLFGAGVLAEMLAPGRDYQTHRLEFSAVDDVHWLSPEAARVGSVPLTEEPQADGTVHHRIELMETAPLPVAGIRSFGFEFDVADRMKGGEMVPGRAVLVAGTLTETGGGPQSFLAQTQHLTTESSVEFLRVPGAAVVPAGTNQRAWQLVLVTAEPTHLALRAHVTVPGFVAASGPYVPSPMHGLLFHRLGSGGFGLESGPRYAFPFGFYTTAATQAPSSRASQIAFLWENEGGAVAVLRWCISAVAVLLAGLCLFPRSTEISGAAWRAGVAAGAIFLGCGLFQLVVTPPFNGVNETAHIFSYHRWWGDTNATQASWRLGLRNHYSRLQSRMGQKFTDSDRVQPLDHFILDPGTIDTHPVGRSASAALLWRLSRPWIAGQPAAAQILRLRLLSLLVVAVGVALSAGVLTRTEPGGHFTPWLGWSVLVLPSLPYLAMNVSNYPVLIAAGLVMASALAALVDRRRLDPWPGLLLGAGASVALHTSRSAQPLVIFLGLLFAAIPVIRLVQPPGDPGGIWRFWGALTCGFLSGRLISNAEYDAESVASLAGFAARVGFHHLPPFWLAIVVLGAVGAVADRLAAALVATRSHGTVRSFLPGMTRFAWLVSALILAGMLFNCVTPCPTLGPLREVLPVWDFQPGQEVLLPSASLPRPSDAHPSVRAYVIQALRAAAGSVGPGDRDYMTSKLFWTQVGDGDAFAPNWLIGALSTLFALGAALHYWRISEQRDAVRLVLVTAIFIGAVAYFVGIATACLLGSATPSLHGRYLYVCYLILIVTAFTGWKGPLLRWQQCSPNTFLVVVLGMPLFVQLLVLHEQLGRYF